MSAKSRRSLRTQASMQASKAHEAAELIDVSISSGSLFHIRQPVGFDRSSPKQVVVGDGVMNRRFRVPRLVQIETILRAWVR